MEFRYKGFKEFTTSFFGDLAFFVMVYLFPYAVHKINVVNIRLEGPKYDAFVFRYVSYIGAAINSHGKSSSRFFLNIRVVDPLVIMKKGDGTRL
ncbi:hypothetical protein V1478_016097 [Vespula squamosa]|uniref:RDD domain-containing protein n=1 Tax=Vespula squamosa TaxID=30214 RepID=A0ABD2A1G8_VESSQ